jgi:hypothetical protein
MDSNKVKEKVSAAVLVRGSSQATKSSGSLGILPSHSRLGGLRSDTRINDLQLVNVCLWGISQIGGTTFSQNGGIFFLAGLLCAFMVSFVLGQDTNRSS